MKKLRKGSPEAKAWGAKMRALRGKKRVKKNPRKYPHADGYFKVRFYSLVHGASAGLVLRANKRKMSVSDLSRLFPYSETSKMNRVQYSPIFPTWDEAFKFVFPEPGSKKRNARGKVQYRDGKSAAANDYKENPRKYKGRYYPLKRGDYYHVADSRGIYGLSEPLIDLKTAKKYVALQNADDARYGHKKNPRKRAGIKRVMRSRGRRLPRQTTAKRLAEFETYKKRTRRGSLARLTRGVVSHTKMRKHLVKRNPVTRSRHLSGGRDGPFIVFARQGRRTWYYTGDKDRMNSDIDRAKQFQTQKAARLVGQAMALTSPRNLNWGIKW